MNAKRYDFWAPITGPWSVSPVHISFGLVHSNRPKASVEYDTVTRPPPGPSWTRPARPSPRQPAPRTPEEVLALAEALKDPPDLRRRPPRLLPLQ